jgi:hypothetical protein
MGKCCNHLQTAQKLKKVRFRQTQNFRNEIDVNYQFD